MAYPFHPLDVAAQAVGGREAFATALGVTVAALGNWKARGVPVQRCVAIERLAAGTVTRRDLRPGDWQDIWPELADSEENPPAAPATQAPAAIKNEASQQVQGVSHG